MPLPLDLDAPRAAWLFKMSHGFAGKAKWHPRFFILLDTELRCYKDEHAESPSQTLHLSEIKQVIPLMDRPNTFRLEPTLAYKQRQNKPWTIECSSHHEMALWYECLQHRIKLTPIFEPPVCTRSSRSHYFLTLRRKKQPTITPSFSTPPILMTPSMSTSSTSTIQTPPASIGQRRGAVIQSLQLRNEPFGSLHPLELPPPTSPTLTCTTLTSSVVS
ncbi:PH-domain-containing protein [Hesseltinella vesiculosa]|uniref:PH-domain-containing protein n=1 Tax=Hesseltinella vesiculosa TaxID=101127 RepID=A0A1X2G700_9FUNG|nr:PH-domain-containing protein [Hesseltinella vesiculosa]